MVRLSLSVSPGVLSVRAVPCNPEHRLAVLRITFTYVIVFSSPEIVNEDPFLNDILRKPRFRERLCCVAIDEAHLVVGSLRRSCDISNKSLTFHLHFRRRSNMYVIFSDSCLRLYAQQSQWCWPCVCSSGGGKGRVREASRSIISAIVSNLWSTE